MVDRSVRHIISAPKRIKSIGQWSSGAMPRTAFPLSKAGAKSYKLGNRRWRVVTFEACSLHFRILINYSFRLSQYQAILGVDDGGDTKVLLSLERHPTHLAWHAHVCCLPIKDVPAGMKRGPWVKLMNGSGRRHRIAIPATDDEAFGRAILFFGLDRHLEGGFV
jgi:hypothetical protein